MYEAFFELKEKPFSLLPDPSYLYLSQKHQMALSLLEYSLMNQAGFCVISGETGAGKTTLLRHILNQLGNNVTVGMITNTHQSFGELLRWILMAFNLDHSSDSKPQLYQTFVNFLIEQYGRNRNTVLIVDEAQNMSPETLEELRMLSNINADKDQVLQIILAGQPGLRDKLRRPDLEQFAQRIVVDYHLDPLNQEETDNYIRHRTQVAGGSPDLFDREAREAVYLHSGGTPRLINLLCEGALVYGYAEGARTIGARLVHDVVRERLSHGLLPRMRHPLPETPAASEAAGDVRVAPEETGAGAVVAGQVRDAAETGQQENIALHEEAAAAASVVEETPLSLVGEMEAVSQHRVVAAAGQPMANSKLIRVESWSRSAAGASSGGSRRQTSHPGPVSQAEEGIGDAAAELPASAAAPVPTEAAVPADVVQVVEASSVQVTDKKDSTDDSGSKITMNRNELVSSGNLVSDTRGGAPRWILGAALGFSGGLLITVAVLTMLYFKGGMSGAGPTEVAPVSVAPQSGQQAPGIQSSEVEGAMMSALQRERDAALAQAKALERERDAALAASKAREQATAAEVSAARARAREKAAAAEAMQAQEQARSAELEAMLAREREKAAAIEAAKLEAARLLEAKAAAAANQPAPEQPAPAIVVDKPKTETRTAPVQTAAETQPKFSANPCKGPSAKFLSTCKE